MKRYSWSTEFMEWWDDGDYVLYSDHETEVARLTEEIEGSDRLIRLLTDKDEAMEAEIARLRAEVEKVRGYEVAPLEAKVAELRDEVEVLRNALTPFAEFALVRSAAGSTSPKTGPVYSVHTRLGEAEITAEDFEAAFNAIGASA